MNPSWHNATRRSPCPICGKPDWCTLSNDGAVCVCRRVESAYPTRSGGWIHRLLPSTPSPQPTTTNQQPITNNHQPTTNNQQPRTNNHQPTTNNHQPTTNNHQPTIDAARVFSSLSANADELHALLSERLGIAATAFKVLDVRLDPMSQTAAFPMRNAYGAITGIRYRDPDTGRKWSLRGGKDGLFAPIGLPENYAYPHGELVICEGASDTAAALALGIDAVGRSSCTGGTEMLRDFCRLHRERYATIVADADRPGQDGASRLGASLSLVYRIVTPPAPYKDLRAWLTAEHPAEADVRKFFHLFRWKNYPFRKSSR